MCVKVVSPPSVNPLPTQQSESTYNVRKSSTSRVHSLSSIIPSPPKQSISTSNVHKRSTFRVHSLPSIIPAPPTLLCVKPILLEFVLHHLLLLHQHRNAYY